MRNPKISIILPCYNVESYIGQCLDSLITQTIGIENLELIAVNDASTDCTLEILLEYEKQNTEYMTVINLSQNQKQGTARNIGMKNAQGEYIGFVDSDDWVDPEMYQQLYEKAIMYDCDMVSSNLLREYADGITRLYGEKEEGFVRRDKNVLEGNGLIDITEGSIVTKLFRRTMIIENEVWFPEGLAYEDNYWLPILLLYVRNHCWITRACYHYRENLQSTIMSKESERLFDRMIIEKMKLRRLEELGIRERFRDRIEMSFINLYFTNTIVSMVRKFETVPYERFQEICAGVWEESPEYKNNPYLKESLYMVDRALLQMLDMNLTKEEFEQIVYDWKECKVFERY